MHTHTDHNHQHHHHHHHHHSASGKMLYIALAFTLVFAGIEAIGGWVSGSLALLSDAGHMITDSAALALAAFAAWLSHKPPTEKYSYGLLRAEILAALINGLLMLLIIFGIVTAAIDRFQAPQDVSAGTVIIIASMGLVVNIIVAWVLMQGEENVNTKAALIHVMADLMGSVTALISGIVIYFTDWNLIDPILSLIICVLILFSTLRLLKEVINVIMESVPGHIELPKVGMSLAAIEKVRSVHDLHIWTLSSGTIAISAHIMIDDMQDWQFVFNEAKHLLEEEYSIGHITLQPELVETFIIQPPKPKT